MSAYIEVADLPKTITKAYDGERVADLVTWAMTNVLQDDDLYHASFDVMVVVKTSDGARSSGYAYDGVPSPSPHTSFDYLVTLKLPKRPSRIWPVQSWYHGYRIPGAMNDEWRGRAPGERNTFPIYDLADIEEEIVHLAAHEATHIQQYVLDLPRSEVDAERTACRTLRQFRETP